MRRLSIIGWLTIVLLTACGGKNTIVGTATSLGGSSSGGSSSSSGGSGTANASALTAMSNVTSIPSDGSASATITVLALNSSNNLISGVDVTFAADSGGIAVTTPATNSSGAATATLSTAGNSTPRVITVTATAGGLTATVKVQVVATSTAATTAVASLTLASSATSILSDGSTTATIAALARDASNNVLAGVPVTFAASSGAIQAAAATTDATGTVTAILSTAGNSALRTITVTGSTASLTSTVQVQVVAPSTPSAPVYSMGNGTGTAFVTGAIGGLTSGTLAAGGTSGLQVTIVDQTDTLYSAGPVTVTFNSPCIASGQAEILPAGSSTPSTTITTSTGSLSGSYLAKGWSGSDKIKASATVAGQAIGATGTLTIAAATIGSIQFQSATPTSIGLKGTGLNETSTVIFKVTDSTGGAAANVPVTFALNTTVGGMSLSPASATTGSDGTAQTVVSAGTVHTVVRVTASIASPALSTQSSQLTVSTGLPASGAFSMAVGAPNYGSQATVKLACPNVETWNIDGVTVPMTVYLADRYNNPVPDGTSVAFTTDGGLIAGSCTTPLATPGDGQCAATWTSANPRPGLDTVTGLLDLTYGYPTGYPPLLEAGRATVLATTIGEESFTDINGSGFWQTGDPFVNLGDPWRDDNENGVYDSGEYYLDFVQSGHWQAGSGSFVGITCTGITAGSTCSTSTLAISASHLIIMSTSNANVTLITSGPYATSGFTGGASGLSIAAGGGGVISFDVADLHNNSMAAGTSVSVSFSNTTAGTIGSGGGFTIGCDSEVGGQIFQTTFNAVAAGNGTLTITVASPSGSTTIYNIPITIT